LAIRAWLKSPIQNVLEHRRAPLFLALLAFLLTLPSLRAGLIMDDYFHRIYLLHLGELGASANPVWDLFAFAPARLVGSLQEAGILPWWSDPGINIALGRPLTALTHMLDYALWPDSPALQHLHSLLWYALGVGLVTALYRRLHACAAAAGLAGLLFAVEDAHAMNAGWLASRNALLCLVFGVGMLHLHVSWCRTRASRHLILALFLFAAGLGCGEAVLGAAGCVVAWQLTCEKGSWRERILPIAPYAVIVILWRWLYNLHGYGVQGSDLYIDPGQQPLHFLGAMGERLPLLLTAQWLQAPVDMWLVLPRPAQAAASAVAALLTACLLGIFWNLLRHSALARFWALSMVLSLVPLCAAFPMDRLLLFAGIGGFGLMAALAESCGLWPWQKTRSGSRTRRVALVLLILHGPLAAALLIARTCALPIVGGLFTPAARQAPRGPEVPGQTFVFVNGNDFLVAYLYAIRTATGDPAVPRRLAQLASAADANLVRRADTQTLVITAGSGFLAHAFDRLLARSGRRFSVGEQIERPDYIAEIRSLTSDGRPLEVAFRFRHPLENSALRWLYWKNGRLIEFPLPSVGETVGVEPGGAF
jgi:hypothetical protein